MVFIDIGLSALLVTLAVLMFWRLFDLLNKDGRWQEEFNKPELDVNRTTPSLSSSNAYSTTEQEVK
ncbi:MAG: hypothetical protein JRG81_10360 [Deltaproteobacteria bacterium]|nr:hypothetical protein [Deltaproteobacteria bacterium]